MPANYTIDANRTGLRIKDIKIAGESILTADILWAGEPQTIKKALKDGRVQRGAKVLCAEGTPGVSASEKAEISRLAEGCGADISFRSEDLMTLYAGLSENIIKHMKWELALSEATNRNHSMRDVVTTCAGIAEGSVFLVDKNFRVSYMGGSSCLGSRCAAELVNQGCVLSTAVKEIMERISERLIAVNELENGDFLWVMNINLHLTEAFYILIFTKDESLKDDAALLSGLLLENFRAINLRRKHGDIPLGDAEAFVKALINGRLSSWDEIDAYAKRLPNPPQRHISIAVMKLNPSMRRTSVNAFISRLKALFPGSCCAEVGEEIIMMISSDSKINQPRPQFNNDAMHELLSTYDAYLAFSNATQRLDMVRTNCVLAEKTLGLGMALKEQGVSRIFYFEDYSEYVSIELSLEQFKAIMGHDDLLFLTSPDAVDIYRYDQIHGSNLMIILYYYCKNGGNISAAAADSYMHRNTFASRMTQIKELLPDVDLSDTRVQHRLLSSCRVFRFYNFYYDKKAAKSLSERLSVTASSDR